jgi:hypothetical protein
MSGNITDFNSEILIDVEIGDELIAIDGLLFAEYIQSNIHVLGGSNEYGLVRSALNRLKLINGRNSILPSNHFITYTLRRADSSLLNVTAKVVGIVDSDCIDSTNEVLFLTYHRRVTSSSASTSESPVGSTTCQRTIQTLL